MESRPPTNAFVGSPVERIEDLRLLKGRGRFIDDLAPEGLLHAAILRSSVAHGRIRGIDASAAREKRGVVAGTTLATTVTAVRGDVETAFRSAPYTRREHLSVQRHAAVPMESRGLLAEWDHARGQLTLSGVAKVPFPNRRMLAKMMDLPEQA